MDKVSIDITCCVCFDKFNEMTGDIEERMCMECILINEDPDAINPSGKKENKKETEAE